MIRWSLAFVILLLGALAGAAQQPQPQPQQTPSQIALQLTQIFSNWAQTLEAQQKTIGELQAQVTALTKERDELKAKLEPPTAQK